jgi:hypothetical protein
MLPYSGGMALVFAAVRSDLGLRMPLRRCRLFLIDKLPQSGNRDL